ncbi:transposable element Tcb2 transposase [Trichonephila clavipes]|nr:transposable element Tcb2 transposase [Trichonephila clavipes]
MSSGRSLPQINLVVQGGIQGDSHKCCDKIIIGTSDGSTVKKFCVGKYPRLDTRRLSSEASQPLTSLTQLTPTASSAIIQAQVAPSLASVSSRTIRRRLSERHLGSQRPLRVLRLTPTHRRLRLKWCRARGNWSAAEWNQVVFSDESGFNLSSDDNHVRVWRPRGERFNPAFALQRHTAPTAGVMVWGAIAYNARSLSPLVLTRGTMTA